MRLSVFMAVFVVILPACCMRSGTMKSEISGGENFEVKQMCEDSLRGFASALFSDSMSAEIYVREFSTSPAGDTISAVSNKVITINRIKRAELNMESESLFRGRSAIEGGEGYSAVYGEDLSSSFGSNLRIVLCIAVSFCIIVFLCLIKGKRG